MVLGRERAFNSVRKVRNIARQALQRLNFNVDALQLAGTLSAAKRQMVEIARAVLNDARVIIFDEPTAALTPEETEHLFDLVKALRKRGVAMIFISHALEEALTNADRITVLRNGRLMVTGPASEFDRASLIKHMIGEDLAQRRRGSAAKRAPPTAAPVLQIENLRMGAMVNNMSFSVFPGEITGIAGLIGSGRSEAAKVVMGHTKRNIGGGRIWLNGREVRYSAPAQAVADGVAYVSEDRKLDGFFEIMGVAENIGLGWVAKLGRGWGVAPLRKMRALAEGLGRPTFDPRTAQTNVCCIFLVETSRKSSSPSRWCRSRSLSFSTSLREAWMSAPSRKFTKSSGISPHSGAGVVVISSYLPEILDLSDRILVAKSGTIVAEFARSEASAEKILQAAIH